MPEEVRPRSQTDLPDGFSSICGHPFWYGGPIHYCDIMRAEYKRIWDDAHPPRRWWEFWK